MHNSNAADYKAYITDVRQTKQIIGHTCRM